MSVIVRNEYGAVAVNKAVIVRMIVGDLIEMSDKIILCSRKGKVIKEKPTPFIDPDYFDSVDYIEKRGEVRIRIYIIVKKGTELSGVSEDIFDSIARDFDLLKLPFPESVNVKIKGIAEEDQIIKRNVEFIRSRD